MAAPQLKRDQIKDICALTPMQQGMLHHAWLNPGSPVYHEQFALHLRGTLDEARLCRAWQSVLDRHDALRGFFLHENVSRPAQLIPHRQAVHIERWAHAGLGAPQPADGALLPPALAGFLADDRQRPFALASEHAMRWTLWTAAPRSHWLVWSFHHILLDGWSIGLVMNEVFEAYRQDALGASQPPAPPYSRYQRWLAGRPMPSSLQYWRDTLDGCVPSQLLGSLGAAPANASGGSSDAGLSNGCTSTDLLIDEAQVQALTTLAQAQRCTLAHVLHAAWALVCGRYQDRSDVLVGSVLAARPPEVDGMEAMAGLFIATVPLRLRWDALTPFTHLLAHTRDVSLEASAHAHVSLADIQAACQQGPLLDALLIMQGLPFDDLLGPVTAELRVADLHFREETPFALELSASPEQGGLHLRWKAPGARVDRAMLDSLASSLRQVLDQVLRAPQQPVGQLALVDASARAHLLALGDGGASPEPCTSIVALLARQLAARPEAPALEFAGHVLSYRALDAQARVIAHALRVSVVSDSGASASSPYVALVAERGSAMLAGMLGIVLAGAAYVPVDPDFPSERVALMLEDSGCQTVLLSAALRDSLRLPAGVRVLVLEELLSASAIAAQSSLPLPPLPLPHADDDAYLIYTSGSTGRPKGTRVRQRNAASFFAALPQAFGFTPGQRILALTTMSFDIAGLELLGALCCGMTVVMASTAQARDPAQLRALLRAAAVDVLQITPTRLRLLLELCDDDAALAGLSTLLVGGEALPADLAATLATQQQQRAFDVFNVYGPTETTIWSAASRVQSGAVSLGHALPGERLFVLSEQFALQPVGAIGEIAIGGDGVGAGYYQRADLSAERFRTLPDLCTGPVYLTGDLGRWDAQGHLQFLGRRDAQLKLRGVRVELGEIEHHLRMLPGVQDAVVTAPTDARGETQLVAYVVSGLQADAPQVAAWRSHLATSLPEAMLPAQFVVLAALPQTPNGKTDRRALPAPSPMQTALSNATPRAVTSPVEHAIVQVFAEVLGAPIGPDEDFFVRGGQSLKAMQAIGRINRALRSQYGLRHLYTHRSAAALASLAAQLASSAQGLPRAPDQADYPLSAAQTAMWVLEQQHPGYDGYHVPGAYRIRGPLDLDALERAWAALIRRHEALRTVFVTVNGLPRQRILPDLPVRCTQEDWRGQPPAALAVRIAALCAAPFDLAHGPLLRLVWLDCGKAHDPEGVLVLVEHHLISDGWSDLLLTRELDQAYAVELTGQRAPDGTPSACRYRDFAVWQTGYLASDQAQAHRQAWREVLTLPAPAEPLRLPASGQRRLSGQRPCARHALLDHSSGARLFAAQVPAAQRAAWLACALLLLLHVESGQTDLVIGLPVAGRERAELQDQVGLHLNIVALRCRLEPDASLAAQARQMQAVLHAARARSDYPFAQLVQDLGLPTQAGRHPVFDAMLIFHQSPAPVLELAGTRVVAEPCPPPGARVDLNLELWLDDTGLSGFMDLDAARFDQATALRLGGRFDAVLQALLQRPGLSLDALRLELGGRSTQDETADFLACSLTLNEEF